VGCARRLCADNGWPVIDVTRRSIEETAAAIISLISAREEAADAAK
jgi:regulator of PEP synthase PpsR (kinase-PPPase family)